MAKKVRGPAVASVRSADPAAAGLTTAMNHDDRVGMRLVLRNLELNKRLSNHRHIAVTFNVFAGHVEITLLGNREVPVGHSSDGVNPTATQDQHSTSGQRGLGRSHDVFLLNWARTFKRRSNISQGSGALVRLQMSSAISA